MTFDRQAHDYDVSRWGLHARRLYPSVLGALEPLSFGSVLDVGCGTGALLDLISRSWPQATLRGLDASPGMVEVARRRLSQRAAIAFADSASMPYDDASFDLAVCVDSFHHYPDPQGVLLELRRVLRPRARLVLADVLLPPAVRGLANALLKVLPYGDVRVYSPGELAIMGARARLEEVRWSRAGRRGQVLEYVAS